MEPCKHGHHDGAMHTPCYQCKAEHLETENKRLLKLLSKPAEDHTHRCIACHTAYTPPTGANEDCPACGCDGTPDWAPNPFIAES